MTSEPDARLHLSVWRPARIDRTFLYLTTSGNGSEHAALLDGSAVLEQIYAWDTGPHDWRSSSSAVAVEQIDERLLRPFGDQQSPKNRAVPRLLSAVTALLEDSDVQSGTSWSDCEDTIATGESELNLRVNAALGLLRHIRWIAQVYAEVPDASVLIR